MTKPDSTDAGGVTHDEARAILAEWAGVRTAAKLSRYIDQQEFTLATLTRERDGFADALAKLTAAIRIVPDRLPDALELAERRLSDWETTEPAIPPAPPPGGQGQVEALRREIVEALRACAVNQHPSGRQVLAGELAHKLANLLEQGGEGREG